MNLVAMWLSLTVGILLPIIIAVVIVAVYIRCLPEGRQAALQQAVRFGVGITLGAVVALLISAAVIGLALLLKWARGR